jgi:NAD(P)-dependent dehydrogenase (short-subunit alcohol dehydrogenase family)
MSGIMDGKVCIVTGATSGIGQITALELAKMGASVVAVGRNAQKGAATLEMIKRQSASETVEFLQADLSSQQSIRQLVQAYSDKYDRLHVLVNNAGAVYSKRQTSTDGIEMTIALDHLGPFLLTELLLPLLKGSAPARIVTVSSGVHARGHIHFDDLQGEKHYAALHAYFQAKLANILVTYELARQLQGTGVTANCVAPGKVATNFAIDNGGAAALFAKATRFLSRSPEKGAETSIYVASSPLIEGVTGKYFFDKMEKQSSKESYDEEIARKLWEVSTLLTNAPLMTTR